MKLGKLAQTQSGYTFRSRLTPDPTGEVLVVQMKDIDEQNRLQPSQAIRATIPSAGKHHLLQPGDLLFRSRGRSYGAALVDEDIGPAVLAAPLLRIRPIGVLPEYLYWFLNTPATQARLAALAEGTSVQMISTDSLKSLEVPLPSAERQRLIADTARLESAEQDLITKIASRRQRLTHYLLMQQARVAES